MEEEQNKSIKRQEEIKEKEELIKEQINDKLTAIITEQSGIETPTIGSTEVSFIEKGSHVSTDIYHIRVHVKELNNPFNIFGKEYAGMQDPKDIVGDSRPEIDEPLILKFFTNHRGFTPKRYEYMIFNDLDKPRDLLLMEWFPYSLEDIIYNLGQEMKKEEITAEEKEETENKIIDYIKKVIDIYYINNKLLNEKFSPDQKSFVKIDKEYLEEKLVGYLGNILDFVYEGKRREIDRWYMHTPIANELAEVVESLEKGESEGEFLHYSTRLAHILVDPKDDLPKHNLDSILSILKGKPEKSEQEKSPYDGLVIGDLSKVGYGFSQFGLGALLNDPTLVSILSVEKISGLLEYAIRAEQSVKQEKRVSIISDKGEFIQRFNAASRFMMIKALNFISSLNKKYPDSLAEFEKQKPIYNTEKIFNIITRRLQEIDPEKRYEKFNNGFLELYKRIATK